MNNINFCIYIEVILGLQFKASQISHVLDLYNSNEIK